jgi:hypothetical protein
VPNPALCLRVARPDGADAWAPLHEVMNLAGHESHLEGNAHFRLAGVPAAGLARGNLGLADVLKRIDTPRPDESIEAPPSC